jgi:hypothetical protein
MGQTVREVKHEEVVILQEVFDGVSTNEEFAGTCECKGCGNDVAFMMSFTWATVVSSK